MATDPNEERIAKLRAMVDEGLSSGLATPDTPQTHDELMAIARGIPTMVDQLSLPEAAGIEFEPPKARIHTPAADLSDEDFARSGERAWQDYERTGQSRPASAVFDEVQERIDARRQWLSENKSALESSNGYFEENGLPLGQRPPKPGPEDDS